MDNKILELMEKLYSEFSSFKNDMTTEVKGIKKALNDVKEDLSGLKQDIKTLNARMDDIELTVKDISKDVKEIQEEALVPLCEDMIVVKSVVKLISGDIGELSDKIEFIEMKEFNNEYDLFKIKKKFSQ
jgi:archaellum component FlaC